MTCVYKLSVTLPEGCDDPGWQPPDWDAICDDYGWSSSDHGMRQQREWPGWDRIVTRRLSFTYAAAERRRALLERCGASASIAVSEPVTWPALAEAEVTR